MPQNVRRWGPSPAREHSCGRGHEEGPEASTLEQHLTSSRVESWPCRGIPGFSVWSWTTSPYHCPPSIMYRTAPQDLARGNTLEPSDLLLELCQTRPGHGKYMGRGLDNRAV